MTISFTPIGVIHSPFKEQKGTPIQPRFARDARGEVHVDKAYVDALADLEGFERIWLLFHIHRAGGWRPAVVPYRDTVKRGLFATRAPSRPCPIGLSAVRLLSIVGNVLTVEGLDVLDGTPLIDIKPYVPTFDAYPDSRAGWFDQSASRSEQADERFKK